MRYEGRFAVLRTTTVNQIPVVCLDEQGLVTLQPLLNQIVCLDEQGLVTLQPLLNQTVCLDELGLVTLTLQPLLNHSLFRRTGFGHLTLRPPLNQTVI